MNVREMREAYVEANDICQSDAIETVLDTYDWYREWQLYDDRYDKQWYLSLKVR